MDGTGDQFLPRSTLAFDQHGAFAGRDPGHQLIDVQA